MSRLPTPGSDKGTWGGILNEFLSASHNNNGTLKTVSLTAAGAEVVAHKDQPNGYVGLGGDGLVPAAKLPVMRGISQQTSTVHEACEFLATLDDLDAFGAYAYDNGAAGVGATLTGGGNGHLVASGVSVTAGARIVANASNMYGGVPEAGTYVVTATGSASAPYVLTRTSDADSPETLGVFFAVHVAQKTAYFLPADLSFTVGATRIGVVVEAMDAHAENGATASGHFAHAEGSSQATGGNSHAEATSTASGESAHAEGGSLADGGAAHAEGSSRASGVLSHAETLGNALGDYAHAEAFSTASGSAAHAEGSADAYASGMHAEGFGAPLFAAQVSRVTRAHRTTDDSPTLLLDRHYGGSIIFPDYDRAALVRMRVVARRSDVIGTVSAWTAQCIIEGDNTGSYRFVGSRAFTLIAQDSDASTWAVADLEFNGFEPRQLQITVIGENGKTIDWTATIELDEVS